MSKCCHDDSTSTQHVQEESGCCDSDTEAFDYLLWVPLTCVLVFYGYTLIGVDTIGALNDIGVAVYDLMNTMAIGLLVGILMVSVLSYVPRELVIGIFGQGNGLRGICRATLAGVLLDLCSHGILMVGAKLYERGVSTGQVMAFLIASPWNSLSLTVILVAFIGLGWTLMFIALSMVVAVVSGLIFDLLVKKRRLPRNPYAAALPEDFRFWPRLQQEFRRIDINRRTLWNFVVVGLRESRIVIRWLLIGVLIAALIRTFVADEHFSTYFGPTILGLAVTMLAATIIEVCSEGATPLAADIFNRAGAPGNSFAFLMAGVSTDYTEIMVIKERTRSWRLALFLPLVTLPQIICIALALNMMN